MRTKLTFLLALAFFNLNLWAQNIPEKPNPARFVNDYAKILSESEVATLEQKLRNYQDSTSNQFAVVTVSSLENYDIESYSYAIAKSWGIGQKEKNNGLLILIAPNERKMRIEVGYGLEGAIPDAVCKQIIREVMKPYFKQQNYYGGIEEATNYLIKYASGEYKADPKAAKGISAIWILVFIAIILILSFISKYQRAKSSHIGGPLDFWTILSLMSMNNRGGGGNGFGGGGSDSGSSWDFGGGGFGGGGSSGDW
jgi:uncharacterized protein